MKLVRPTLKLDIPLADRPYCLSPESYETEPPDSKFTYAAAIEELELLADADEYWREIDEMLADLQATEVDLNKLKFEKFAQELEDSDFASLDRSEAEEVAKVAVTEAVAGEVDEDEGFRVLFTNDLLFLRVAHDELQQQLTWYTLQFAHLVPPSEEYEQDPVIAAFNLAKFTLRFYLNGLIKGLSHILDGTISDQQLIIVRCEQEKWLESTRKIAAIMEAWQTDLAGKGFSLDQKQQMASIIASWSDELA